MDNRKLISTILFSFAALSVAAGILAIVPYSAAKEVNVLGFKSLCPFAPVSTLISLFVANGLYGIRKKKFL